MVHLVSWRLLHTDITKYAVAMATLKTGYKNGYFFLSFIEPTVLLSYDFSVLLYTHQKGNFKSYILVSQRLISDVPVQSSNNNNEIKKKKKKKT